jgi:hypothetical protein
MTTWSFVPSFFSNLWVFCTVYTIDLSIVIKRRLSKVVSAKLTDKDYELCQRIARDYYIKGNIIRTPAVSQLARLALELIFSTRRPGPIVDNLLKSQPRLAAQLLKALHSNYVDNHDDEFAALS